MHTLFDPSTHTFTDEEGIKHRLVANYFDPVVPEEVLILSKFKTGKMSLQEAYTLLLEMKLRDLRHLKLIP